MKEFKTSIIIGLIARCFVLFAAFNTFFKVKTPEIIMYATLISALILVINRDYYLPFLGQTAIPGKILSPTQRNLVGNDGFKLSGLPPEVPVMAWAAAIDAPDPIEAYGDYSNSVITTSNKSGEAVVLLNCPGKYLGTQHIHYRYADSDGLMSRVYTQSVKCENKIELNGKVDNQLKHEHYQPR